MAPVPSRSGSGLNTPHYQSHQKLPIVFALNSQIPACAGMTGFFIPDSSARPLVNPAPSIAGWVLIDKYRV